MSQRAHNTGAASPSRAGNTGAAARQGAALGSLRDSLGDATEGALAAAQARAFERFSTVGFPGPRSEAWRQFNIASLAMRPLKGAGRDRVELSAGAVARIRRVTGDAPTLVFVNGVHRSDLDHAIPAHVTIRSLGNGGHRELDAASAIESAADSAIEPWALDDLSLALTGDRVSIAIEAAADTPTELHLVYLAAGPEADTVSAPRIELSVAAGASASVLEHMLADSAERPVVLVHTRLALEAGATLTHLGVPRLAHGGLSLQRLEATLATGASLETFHCALDDASARTDCIVSLDAPTARMQFAALALARGNQQLDYLVRARHEAPETHSDQVFKAIATDRAQTIFTTCARVARDAQQIVSEQLARGLLLSGQAQINTRPQLEIYADDVVCSHGATVGQLDEDALFYLRARGVPLSKARAMLLDAFTEDLLVRFPIERVAEEARARAYAFTHGEGEADQGDSL